MGVPAEIRAVKRPRNTVVLMSTTGRYPVRERIGCRHVVGENGKVRKVPIDGDIIGHIIDGVYIANEDEIPPVGEEGEVDLKDWANVFLCDLLNRDAYEDLKTLYNLTEATTIYVVAILRGCYPGISDYLLQRQYEETFLTEMLPPVNLEKSSVSVFLRNMGRGCGRMAEFARRKVHAVESDDTVIVDGTLQTDDSSVNSLSAVSRKTHAIKRRHTVIMYAYSVNRMEPICSQVYPGNMVDKRIVKSFVEDIDLQVGIVVGDKGFTLAAMMDALSGRPDIHFVIPLERDDPLIEAYDMYAFEGRLKDERGIVCKKAEAVHEGVKLWLYSFRDPEKAMEQEILYMANHQGDSFDPDDYRRHSIDFGVIVFASDQDLDIGRVYSIYSDRWLIEMFFKFRKDNLDIDDTREHSDYSVIASEFIDSLASTFTSRMFNHMESRGILDNRTYGQAYGILERLKMTRVGDGGWKVRRTAKVDAEVAEKLGLIRRPIVPAEKKRGPGRPKGSRDKKPRKSRKNSPEAQDS